MSVKVNNFITSFDFPTFARFLKRLKWSNDGKYNDCFTIWHQQENIQSEYEIILPENNNIKLFSETIKKALDILSDCYNKTYSQIIDDFNNTIEDKVKYSLKSEMTKNGLIPLNQGIQLLDNAKEMIMSSFLATNKKKKNYLGTHPESVKEVMDAIELGQTEEGSFVINIYIPQNYFINDEATLFEEPSFSRKALALMEDAVNELLSKIDEYLQNDDITIFDVCVDKGVSSNFCNAISGISANGKNDIKVEIEYNNGIDKNVEIKTMLINKELIPIINKVAVYFNSDLMKENYQIKGFVTILHKETNDFYGEVTLAAWVEDKFRKVRMQLRPEHYLIAIQAHREKNMLVCKGTLSIQDRHARLLDITDVLLEAEG
jgi:hypothetical protein